MSEPRWEVQMIDRGKYTLHRDRPGERGFFNFDVYTSPGCHKACRFKTREAANLMADKLNGKGIKP